MYSRRAGSVVAAVTLLIGACGHDQFTPPPPPPPPPPVVFHPAVALGRGLAVRAGDSLVVPLVVADSGGAAAAPWTWQVNWGDGSSVTGTLTASGSDTLSHVFGREGQYLIRATVSDAGGVSAADSSAVSVAAPITLIGAGDIGMCGYRYAAQTAAIIDTLPGSVFTAGDNAYPNGAASDFANCYDPAWGTLKARTRPAPGNHEYQTAHASGYFGYFGDAAGDSTTGYYSYDLGDWHVVVLNSALGMLARRTEEAWLGNDLRAHAARCTVAIWHHPLFSSTRADSSGGMTAPMWDSLYAAGAEIIIAGHVHNYERFAPQTPAGASDPVQGVRQFVVGTGGAPLDHFGPPITNSEVRDEEHGVLELTLRRSSYAWRFIPVTGVLADSGSAGCH